MLLLGTQKGHDGEVTLENIRILIAQFGFPDDYQTIQPDQKHHICVSFQILTTRHFLGCLPVVVDLRAQFNGRVRALERDSLGRSLSQKIVQKRQQFQCNQALRLRLLGISP